MSVAIDYDRKEIETKKSELEKLKEKQSFNQAQIVDLVVKCDKEKDQKAKELLQKEVDKCKETIIKTDEQIRKIQSELNEKEELAKDLEKELVSERQRLHVLYWNYAYRGLLFLGVIILTFLLNRAIRLLLRHMAMENRKRYLTERICKLILYVTSGIILIFVFMENLMYVATILGIASAGLAIALQDVFTSFVGWLILVFHKEIEVGDRIEIANVKGDILEIGILKTTLIEFQEDQETGRIVFLGNNLIFKQPMFNYTFGHQYVWDRVRILITYESDWKKAHRVLSDLLEEKTKATFEKANRKIQQWAVEYMMKFQEIRPKIVTSIEDSGILFSLRYICETDNLLAKREEITRAILEAFETDESLNFAYPTQRIIPTAKPEQLFIHPLKQPPEPKA
jgi:small-conductance mechanosensitive channel